MRLVQIDKLNTGESLGFPIRSQDGRVLLAANSVITKSYLEHLRRYKITNVFVEDALFDDVDISPALSEQSTIEVMAAVSQMLKDMGKKKPMNEFKIKNSAKMIAEDVHRKIRSPINLINLYAIDDDRVIHSVNTAVITAAISYFCEIPITKIIDYTTAALVHDITLEKYNDTDYEHAVSAAEYIKSQRLFNNIVAASVSMHHECFDGSGGPNYLVGDKIYEGARILAVADQYDRLVNGLGCKRQPAHMAVEYLNMLSGRKLDPAYLVKFGKCVAIFPTGATVMLSNGYRAIVTRQNEGMPTRPVVKLLMPQRENCIEFNLISNKTMFIESVDL